MFLRCIKHGFANRLKARVDGMNDVKLSTMSSLPDVQFFSPELMSFCRDLIISLELPLAGLVLPLFGWFLDKIQSISHD